MLPVFRGAVAGFYGFEDGKGKARPAEENMDRAAELVKDSLFVFKVRHIISVIILLTDY